VAEAVVLLAAPWLIGASGMPVRLQPPAVLLCWLVQAVLLWRRLAAPCRVLWLQEPTRPLLLDGMELDDPALHVRGPWLQLRWQGPGKTRGVLLFWPDVLSPGQRRELRLAVRARQVSRKPP
jgi:hypothetical protein